MTDIRAEIEIHAPAERVWQVLTDFPAYPQWNPVMCVSGDAAKVGGRLAVRVQPPRGRAMNFCATVLGAEAGHELRWEGHLLSSSLFAGEHSFAIEPLDNGRVRFVQREVYTGILAPFIILIIGASNRQVFESMNKALKARAEKAPGA